MLPAEEFYKGLIKLSKKATKEEKERGKLLTQKFILKRTGGHSNER